MQVLDVLETMGIGKNTTSKSVEAGGSTEGKYEDESKHPTFFTLPVSSTFQRCLVGLGVNQGIMLQSCCTNPSFPQAASGKALLPWSVVCKHGQPRCVWLFRVPRMCSTPGTIRALNCPPAAALGVESWNH